MSDLADVWGPDALAYPVCYPLHRTPVAGTTVSSVRMVTGENGRRILAIRTEPQSSDVYAMVAGRVHRSGTAETRDGRCVRLETEFFGVLAWLEGSLGPHARWFMNWLLSPARTIPTAVVYHNVELRSDLERPPAPEGGGGHMDDEAVIHPADDIHAGNVIGRIIASDVPGPPQADLLHETELGISFEYPERTSHPVELFSLLFWQAEHDPFFSAAPTPPAHPLIRMMHERRADGSADPDAEGFRHADWLGLRPPLRTYKRVEWEARQTHAFHHSSWIQAGNVRDVIRNPLIRNDRGDPRPYAGASKCNVITGELLFRGGFRCHSYRTGADNLGYANGGVLWSSVRGCTAAAGCDGQSMVIDNPDDVTWDGTAYRHDLPFGTKRYVTDAATLNAAIEGQGKVYLYSRWQYGLRWPCRSSVTPDRVSVSSGGRCQGPAVEVGVDLCGNGQLTTAQDSDSYEYKIFHIFVVTHVTSILPNKLGPDSTGLDQSCVEADARGGASFAHDIGGDAYSGAVDGTQRVFVEVTPGGDPSEPWGVADLNCLRAP
jgi:hypothetical protein